MRQGFQPLSDWGFDLKLTPMPNPDARRPLIGALLEKK